MAERKLIENISAAILAGGKSSRMGVNKALLQLGGQKIIERTVELMRAIFSEVIIITNTPEEYKFLDTPLFEDIYKWKGPLAGIHSALTNSKSEKIFVLSCDVPLMSREMIEYIINYKTDKPIRICESDGNLQPLVGVYSKKILDVLEKFLTENDQGDKSVRSFLKISEPEIINPQNLAFYKEEIFFNVNSPEDFEYMKKYFTHNN